MRVSGPRQLRVAVLVRPCIDWVIFDVMIYRYGSTKYWSSIFDLVPNFPNFAPKFGDAMDDT